MHDQSADVIRLQEELALAQASVILLSEDNDKLKEQVKSLLGFQSSAHQKKVRAKHDRDDVINQKVVLELENKRLKEEVEALKSKLANRLDPDRRVD
jgi:hypothetical protein